MRIALTAKTVVTPDETQPEQNKSKTAPSPYQKLGAAFYLRRDCTPLLYAATVRYDCAAVYMCLYLLLHKREFFFFCLDYRADKC